MLVEVLLGTELIDWVIVTWRYTIYLPSRLLLTSTIKIEEFKNKGKKW